MEVTLRQPGRGKNIQPDVTWPCSERYQKRGTEVIPGAAEAAGLVRKRNAF